MLFIEKNSNPSLEKIRKMIKDQWSERQRGQFLCAVLKSHPLWQNFNFFFFVLAQICENFEFVSKTFPVSIKQEKFLKCSDINILDISTILPNIQPSMSSGPFSLYSDVEDIGSKNKISTKIPKENQFFF